MFQTEVNLWLQSMGSNVVTALLAGVSLLGYVPTYALLIVTLTFGARMGPGLAVLGAVLFTGVVTDAGKEAVAFPRPDQVDDRLMRTFASGGDAVVARGGAPDFWSAPSRDAIDKVRALDRGNYGFPSSHVSATTAFFVCSAWFLRARWLYAWTAAWVPLMVLSRLYLGRHFLADVLGGLVIGLAVSAAWVRLFPERHESDETWPGHRRVQGLWLLTLALLVLALLWPPLPARYVGAIMGLAITYSVVFVTGTPPDGGTTGQRVGRIALALTLFATSLGATGWVLVFAGGGLLLEVLTGATVTASTFAGTIVLSRRLRLYAA